MKKLFAALAMAVAASAAWGQSGQFTVSSGAPTGSTYTQMTTELISACSDVPVRQVNSSGAIENMDRIVGNKVNGAIVQTDILYLRGRTDNLLNIKTLFTLHPEEVHVVVKSAGIKPRGVMNAFSKRTSPRTVSDTQGITVASWGGSAWSARIVSELGRLGWTVQEAKDASMGLGWLAKDEVDAVLAVGGAPLGSLSGLTADFRLVPFDSSLVEELSKVYVPAQVTYTNLNSAGIKTVATEALLVTRDYKSQEYTRTLSGLRRCLAQKLPALRETTGNHPKWELVNLENRGKWQGYWEPSR